MLSPTIALPARVSAAGKGGSTDQHCFPRQRKASALQHHNHENCHIAIPCENVQPAAIEKVHLAALAVPYPEKPRRPRSRCVRTVVHASQNLPVSANFTATKHRIGGDKSGSEPFGFPTKIGAKVVSHGRHGPDFHSVSIMATILACLGLIRESRIRRSHEVGIPSAIRSGFFPPLV